MAMGVNILLESGANPDLQVGLYFTHFCLSIFTVRKRSCGKVLFLHLSVSHSVHRGVSAPVHAGIHTPLGRHPSPRQTPLSRHPLPGRHPLLGRHPLGRHSPRADTPPPQQTATAADATHPAGMHSCLGIYPNMSRQYVNEGSQVCSVLLCCSQICLTFAFHVG